MLFVPNIPIVIEPGVSVLEADCLAVDNDSNTRHMHIKLQRLVLDSDTAANLPFIPTTKQPHVFTIINNLQQSPLLIIYDFLGRLHMVYTRGDDNSWERRDVAEEQVGRTVTQFSVRFSFASEKTRDKFMSAIGQLVDAHNANQPLDSKLVKTAITFLARSRTPPVLIPVAAAKDDTKKLKV
ncbi:hypothetical protein EBZ39_03505 [bacterium]|nr:hypothetical protein [bacterium]